MRRFNVVLILTAIILTNLSYLSAQSNINSIDSLVNGYIDNGELNGVVLVAAADRVISSAPLRIRKR